MGECLFRFVGQCPLPIIFDTDSNGSSLVADGVEIFTLRQASRKARLPQKQLRALHEAAMAELTLGSGDGSVETPIAPESAPAEFTPITESTTSPVETPPTQAFTRPECARGDRYRAAVRRLICQDLSEEMFEDFLAICEARHLDPLKRQIWPRTTFNEVEKVLEVIGETTIDGFRAIANRDARFDGLRGPYFRTREGEWTETWDDDDDQPYAAKAVVVVKGRMEPCVAIVKWKEFAPYSIGKNGEIIYEEFWQKMPSHMLGKVAQAHAYRMALPESLGGLYIGEELAAIERERKKIEAEAEELRRDDEFDDSLPQTLHSLKLRLMDDFNLGMNDAEYRIRRHRERFPAMVVNDEAHFCRAVYRAIRDSERSKGNILSRPS